MSKNNRESIIITHTETQKKETNPGLHHSTDKDISSFCTLRNKIKLYCIFVSFPHFSHRYK